MAGNVSMTLSESLNSSLLSNGDWQYQLEDLPNELLALILGYLPLPDLANIRSVCSRLQKLVDDRACKHLWANASLEGSCLWLTDQNKTLIHRAADNGSVEALIMLGVAYLYSEGVPEGAGKGTYNAYNGIKATEYLIRAETLTPTSPPFTWALFRPPWAHDTMCSKKCVCQRMKGYCSGNTTVSTTRIHYCIGKALSFNDNTTESDDAQHWYELGSEASCLCSRLELWRSTYKQQLLRESFEPLRQLRAIVSQSGPSSLLEAQLELCSAYARGFYGGKSRTEALGFVREVVQRARPMLWESMFELRKNISQNVRYILMDWVIEVAGLKHFSPQTVHLAVSLMDRFLLLRPVPRSDLQLLGITALILAARWSSEFILTVREAAWLTELTYKYDAVVRMMGRLVATFRGEVKKETVTDYMDVMLDLVRANTHTRNMAYYLSECLLLHTKFGRYSASHLAAACVLDARVLLGTEYPWPQSLVEATGLSVSDLRSCCLALYDQCLTDKNTIMDHRKVKLEAVYTRYNSKMFGNISEQKLMSYKELKEQLGVDPETSFALFTPTPKPHRHANCSDKLLSFLSDSCYLTPGTKQLSTLSDSESDSDSDIDSDMADQLEFLSASSSPSPLDLSASEVDRIPPPFSPSQCSSKSLNHSPSGSGFPQPLFDDDDLTLSSPPRSAPRSRRVVSASHGASNGLDSIDTEDTLFAQSRGPLASNISLEMPSFPFALTGPSPNSASSSSGYSKGSEETPIEYDSVNSRHPAAAEQQLLASVSNSLKMLPFKARQAPSERVALKSVENIPSPRLGGRVNGSENHKLSKGPLVAKKQSKRKSRVP